MLFEYVMNQELPGVWQLNKFLLNNWNPEKTVYSWVMPDNFHVDCHVQDSLTFSTLCLGQEITFVKKVEQPTKIGKFLSANLAHSIDGLINREITMRCNFSEEYKNSLKKLLNLNAISSVFDQKYYKQSKHCLAKFKELWERYEESGFLSARILQYVGIDALKLVGTSGITALKELVDSLPQKTFEVYSVHDCFKVLPTYGNDLRQQYRNICKQIADSKMLDCIVSSMLDEPVHFKKLDDHLGDYVMQSEYAVC